MIGVLETGRRAGLMAVTVAAVLAGVHTAGAETVTIAAPTLPPHVTAEGKGREAQIIRETLEACDHEVRFETAAFGSHWTRYREKERLDAVTTVPEGKELPGQMSQPYVRYQNGVSVLESADLDVDELADLEGRDIVTFQDGIEILGLSDKREMFGRVHEVADQEVHSRLLFAGRVDAVLSDGLIFAAFNRRLRETKDVNFDPNQDVRFTAVVPPTAYRMAFRDAGLRDDFDRCFQKLKAEGRIEAINTEHISRFRDTVGKQYLGY